MSRRVKAIPLPDAAHIASRRFLFDLMGGAVDCSDCDGTGEADCPSCEGDGEVFCSCCDSYVVCTACHGEGAVHCTRCARTGVLHRDDAAPRHRPDEFTMLLPLRHWPGIRPRPLRLTRGTKHA